MTTASSSGGPSIETIDDVESLLRSQEYIADRGLSTAIFLAVKLSKPLLLEGEAGVGKTEVAKALARGLGANLIRLQGYEGIDVASAVYEWNYARQIMAIRLSETSDSSIRDIDLFAPEFLISRPILQALQSGPGGVPPILLIDELDRADDEFEAFLLEVLSDFQVTIPEIGTIKADQLPLVIITSNRTREMHDALKRRCLYHWIDYPSYQKERDIVAAKVPGASEALAAEIVRFVQALRHADLYKAPGMAETLDWARALLALGEASVTEPAAKMTLGVLLKNQEDIERVEGTTLRELVSAPESRS